MRGGALDRRITIEQRALNQNTSGGMPETWTTFQTVWAGKKDLRGEELYAAQKENALVTTIWTLRYIDGVTNDMRINYGGLMYDITFIAEIGRRQGLQISAFARPS